MKRIIIAILVFTMIFAGQAFGAKSVKGKNKALSNTSVKSAIKVNFAGRPDLMVQMVTVNPPMPVVSHHPITIRITVKNRGNGPTSAVCHLNMSVVSVDKNGNRIPGNNFMSAIPMYAKNIPVLGPGAKHEIKKIINLHHAGRNRIEGVINTESLKSGEELNNQNNNYKTYFTVKPKPAPADLVLHKIGVTSGGEIKIRMSNKGKAIPDYDFNRAWVKAEVTGSSPYKQILLKDIDPNGRLKKPKSSLVDFVWPDTGPRAIKLTPGYSYEVTVTLDCFPRIIDSNRSNNSKIVTLSP
jgi:hypothetical protein